MTVVHTLLENNETTPESSLGKLKLSGGSFNKGNGHHAKSSSQEAQPVLIDPFNYVVSLLRTYMRWLT